MRYWDASALVPLLVQDTRTAGVHRALRQDPNVITWWGTRIECTSAVSRLERDEALDAKSTTAALALLQTLTASWHEVLPGDAVRDLACRLLRVHPLRAADALQLAAALVATEQRPNGFGFMAFDTRLLAAAEREGFTVGP
jgi:uncharacterized protein